MESSEGTPFARAFPMPDLLHPFSMIAEVFCFLNNESQKLVPTRNFSHLEAQKFVPPNYKISPIRKIYFDFEITRMISDQIVLHSVQLPI